MADIKISNLPAGTVAGTSLVPIVVGGVTSQTTAQDIANLDKTEVIISVTSAEALAIFTTPKTILAAPGAGLYYKYTAVLEQTFVTTAYTVSGGGDWYLNQGSKDYYFAKAAVSHTADAASHGTYSGFATSNTALTLTADSNPTLGDGTFKLKIWYTIETFGS